MNELLIECPKNPKKNNSKGNSKSNSGKNSPVRLERVKSSPCLSPRIRKNRSNTVSFPIFNPPFLNKKDLSHPNLIRVKSNKKISPREPNLDINAMFLFCLKNDKMEQIEIILKFWQYGHVFDIIEPSVLDKMYKKQNWNNILNIILKNYGRIEELSKILNIYCNSYGFV